MKYKNYFSLEFKDDKLIFLDQTKIPLEEVYVETDDLERIAGAIERLEVRGAPLIGVVAAYGLALAMKDIGKSKRHERFNSAYKRLASTRPTAVNLFWALDQIKDEFEKNVNEIDLYLLLIKKARELHQDDVDKCNNIAKNGLRIFKKKSVVITHCNTGKLATAGEGTAFSVIKLAFEKGLIEYVYADETRPLLQGSRLTAFELDKNNIPFSIISDSMAASLMKQNKIDLAITGADRIALNGDSANKIGTYSLAVNCYHHDLPFYIAAPTTTFDRTIRTGEEINIEIRKKTEILSIRDQQITPEHYNAYNPAFDVTPSHLITGIITDEDLYSFPYNFLK